MVQLKLPPLHDDKNAQKLMDKISKMKAVSEKKQSRADSSQASSQGAQQKPR